MKRPPWLRRLVPYLGRGEAEEDLEEELRLHLELERERRGEAGLSEADALRAARRTLGNATLIRERTRDVWGWRWLDDLGRDARHAVRGLGRSPGFAATVVLVLALGIGANTAMFSIVYGMLIRSLPYPDSEAIVSVGRRLVLAGSGRSSLLNAELHQLWDNASSFEQLAALTPTVVFWDGPDGPVPLQGTAVTPSLFPLLRAAPRLGRLLTEADAVEGAHRVVLLSHGAWTSRFGSAPDVIGAQVELDGDPHTVIGVLPDGFDSPLPGTEIYTPLVVAPNVARVDDATVIDRVFMGIGRLRPGVSPEQAETEVREILDRRGADRVPSWRHDFETRVMSLREEQGRPFRPALAMIGAATGLVLLMACANIAGLLLARGIVRRRELAIRAALGAGRGRIVRQLLAESVVLSVVGGAMGVGVVAGIVHAAPLLVPYTVPGLAAAGADGVVLVFAAGLSLISGLLFGVAPALAMSRVGPVRTRNGGGLQTTGGSGRPQANKGHAALAVVQVALALVLLTGTALLLRDFVALVTIDLALDPTNVVIARVLDPPSGAFNRPISRRRIGPDELDALRAANRRLAEALLTQMERIESLAGVEAVALSSTMPLAPPRSVRPIRVAGRPAPSGRGKRLNAGIRKVSPDYADFMQLELLAGRFFTNRDEAGSPPVAVVSESFAREAFGDEPAVGQRLLRPVGGITSPERRDETYQVIGVVTDVASPMGSAPSMWRAAPSEIYLTMLQRETDWGLSVSERIVSVRTAGEPLAVIPFLREELADAFPGAWIQPAGLDTMWSAQAALPRFYAVCAAIFGTVALLLAAFGIYGLVSYTVAQRRHEIGIRMALGATRGAIVRLVVRQGAALVAFGAALGLVVAPAATFIVESVLWDVSRADALTFATVTTVLLAVALVACYLPARRATRVDPMETLRFE